MGGLFDVHELERANEQIQVADEAFEKLFDFFDAYKWHLDEHPLRADNEINPDVLGYIFEKYINQKQMGPITPKRTLPSISVRTPSFPSFLMLPKINASSLLSQGVVPGGSCKKILTPTSMKP